MTAFEKDQQEISGIIHLCLNPCLTSIPSDSRTNYFFMIGVDLQDKYKMLY
ncbi:MAG: hypothetical protein ACTSWN_08280 [Promethearchaeota archaeon]